MAHAHRNPLDYSSIQESITSICKHILPHPFRKRKGLLQHSDFQLAKLQSDNLKWQQDSFHHIHKLMGLHEEGILSGSQVSSFRSHLLDTLIASTSPLHQDHTPIFRDNLLFLKELYLAKCISEDEYHSSKRPLLQRLALLGAEIQASDIIVGIKTKMESSAEEEWSEIELGDENVMMLENISFNKLKRRSALRQIKGAASSVLSRVVATSTRNAGSKKQWGFKKSKRSEEDDQRGSKEAFVGRCTLTEQMKRKLYPDCSSSDIFIDKGTDTTLSDSICRTQHGHSVDVRNDDIEVVSAKLPVDTAGFLQTPRDKNGNVVVRKEFKRAGYENHHSKGYQNFMSFSTYV